MTDNSTVPSLGDIVLCGGASNQTDDDYNIGLHVASFFVILVTSTFGSFFPSIVKRIPCLKIPPRVFYVVKHFGTGVITATAFIHLLPAAFAALNDPCLPPDFSETYTAFPGAFAMISMFTIFFVEYFSVAWVERLEARAKLEQTLSKPDDKQTIEKVDDVESELSQTPDGPVVKNQTEPHFNHEHHHHHSFHGHSDEHAEDPGYGHGHSSADLSLLDARSQTFGIIVLELGICFHSFIIGLALSVTTGAEFVALFIALVFHQTFEGLGLGARIAELQFKDKSWKPWVMAASYGLTTPIGIAIGMGIRSSYDTGSQAVLIAQGVLDSVSAGILLYASLVELISHDFIHEPAMRRSSKMNQFIAFFCLLLGAGLMALIGRWA